MSQLFKLVSWDSWVQKRAHHLILVGGLQSTEIGVGRQGLPSSVRLFAVLTKKTEVVVDWSKGEIFIYKCWYCLSQEGSGQKSRQSHHIPKYSQDFCEPKPLHGWSLVSSSATYHRFRQRLSITASWHVDFGAAPSNATNKKHRIETGLSTESYDLGEGLIFFPRKNWEDSRSFSYSGCTTWTNEWTSNSIYNQYMVWFATIVATESIILSMK